MKKIMFVALLMAVSISALEAKRAVLLPNGYSVNTMDFNYVSGNKALVLDTLAPILGSYITYINPPYRIEYEATKLTPAYPCSVIAIFHGVVSETAGASKQCSLFIWSDAAGSPGAVLFKTIATATADSALQVQLNAYNVTPPVYVTGPFWVGNYEMDSLFPTSAVDTICNSTKYRETVSSAWQPDIGDYLHFAIVEYNVSVEEKNISNSLITLKTSPTLFANNASISYSINGSNKDVQIGIYDITGNLVKEIVNGKYNTGTYTACWNGCDKTNKPLSSGIYFCSLTSGNQKITNKMILVK
ncbi:MAG: FlgD immunoglobulin-like domain containing protein [bacterium]|nr:FlgD immunoglobulin-like domain containing protein [bacterium]